MHSVFQFSCQLLFINDSLCFIIFERIDVTSLTILMLLIEFYGTKYLRKLHVATLLKAWITLA
jgi:hypothetical protein